ncbi:hypothetical protein HUJ04_008409 [Dendroctonus ponderosae]|nr:hypothetical protein HUJ04_008409 [Dendroctonus ponderosae]
MSSHAISNCPDSNIHRIREFELEKVNLIDEFDILQIVGEGWFGKILLVEHKATDTEMVLKALPKPYTALVDFYREFHYGLQLGCHKNIISAYDVAFETAGFYVFSQEYAPLGDLTSNVSEIGIGELHTKRVARQLASALEFIHKKDLVHRDIKLDNILVFKSDFSRIKLCDFGETRPAGSVVLRRNEWLPYAAPEILEVPTDETYICKSLHDVWQFGIVIFVCLTGCLPWQKAAYDDPRYVRYNNWQNSTLPILRQPKMFKLVSSRAQRFFKRYLEPKEERRPNDLKDVYRFLDDRWMTKGMEKANETLVEEQGLCPSMYSFHSSPDEKNKLLHTLTQYGLETTVDRCAKKDRIRKWIENSVIVEEDNEEEVDEEQPMISLRTQTIKNINSEKERHRRHHSRRLKEKEYKPPVDPRIPLAVQKNQFATRSIKDSTVVIGRAESKDALVESNSSMHLVAAPIRSIRDLEMKMAHSMQGIYSPLPQSLSDSDSEKEISMDPICTSYNSKNTNKSENSYRQNGNRIGLDEDTVKIKRGASKMSTARKQEGIELKGPINLASGAYKTNYNLVIMYKGSINSDKTLKHGIISLMGLTGNVAWDFEQDSVPIEMDCSIIDANQDGHLDCLVVDLKGLKAIESVSGQTLWHAHSQEEANRVTSLMHPIAITDLDNDGVVELLCVLNSVVYPKTPSDCSYIFDELAKVFRDSRYDMLIEQIAFQPSSTISVANRKLTVTNEPNCPKCHSQLALFDENGKLMKPWKYDNAYIMNPRPFSFQSSYGNKSRLRGHLNGFIVKIWLWTEHYRKLRPTQRINKRSVFGYELKNFTYYSTDIIENVMLITFNDSDVQIINASSTEIHQICKSVNGSEPDCQPSVENQKDSLLVEDLEHDSSRELVSYSSSYVQKGEDWNLMSSLTVFRLEEELPKMYGSKNA